MFRLKDGRKISFIFLPPVLQPSDFSSQPIYLSFFVPAHWGVGLDESQGDKSDMNTAAENQPISVLLDAKRLMKDFRLACWEELSL